MKLVTDSKDPYLVGILDSDQEVPDITNWVSTLNKDLMDSGFENYQYDVIKRGKKLYIEQRKGR